jgi:hypothetical protein
MGIMTNRTVFKNRLMLINKWPLVFRMALKTDIINECFLQIVPVRPMRVMAVTASHFIFPDRVV